MCLRFFLFEIGDNAIVSVFITAVPLKTINSFTLVLMAVYVLKVIDIFSYVVASIIFSGLDPAKLFPTKQNETVKVLVCRVVTRGKNLIELAAICSSGPAAPFELPPAPRKTNLKIRSN